VNVSENTHKSEDKKSNKKDSQKVPSNKEIKKDKKIFKSSKLKVKSMQNLTSIIYGRLPS
jgi:hypothetical protein